NRNMITTVNALDFNSELNKLNKQELIDVIINKRVPNDIVLSDSVRKHINSWETVESHDAKEILDSKLETNITFIETKSESEILPKPHRNVNQPSPTQTYSAVVGLPSISSGSESPVSKPPNTKNVDADNENKLVVLLINSAHGTKTPKKKQVVLGTGAAGSDSASTLMGAEKLCWIHVWQDFREATKDIVQEHLKKSFPNKKFVVDQLLEREGTSCRAFKVGADIDILEKLYKGENWHKNITIRELKNRYKSAIDQEVDQTNHSYIANHTNKSRAMWQVINENIQKPSSQTEKLTDILQMWVPLLREM
ncbi:hypothetical protein HHI36_010780, partial [Cryptolaemus montrouzieri]